LQVKIIRAQKHLKFYLLQVEAAVLAVTVVAVEQVDFHNIQENS
jgi:hypothetical protein